MLGAKLFRTMLLAGCFVLPHQIAVGDCCVYGEDFDWIFPDDPYSEQFLTAPDGEEYYCHYDSEEDEDANAIADYDRITLGDDDDNANDGDSALTRSESGYSWDTNSDDNDSSEECRFGEN